jgi:hypothetical protein
MKTHSQMFLGLAIAAMFLAAACGPAPNPKLQAKAAGTEGAEEQTQTPAVKERPAAALVEEPQPQAVARPKPQVAVKESPAKPRAITRTANAGTPAPAPAPAPAETKDANLAAPRTLSLPAPEAPSIGVPAPPSDEVEPKRVEPPAPRRIRVPSGTLVAVRMIDSVDSATARVGETFKASLDAPIMVDNETVFPEGSEVYVKLTKVQSAGRVSGRSELQLQLDRIFLGNKSYSVESGMYVNTGPSQTARTAKTAGLGAAIGAAIGAISGGGKGAVIGGATGAGAGAGVEAIRKGEQVRVESETRLDFRLEDSVEVLLQSPSSSSSPQRNNPSGPPRFGTRQ